MLGVYCQAMFIPKAGVYTAPVVTYDQLASCLSPDVVAAYEATPPVQHLVTVKTCDSPDLLSRNLESLSEQVGLNYVQPVVVDDSKHDHFRRENQDLAYTARARYCVVSGKSSLVGAFSSYILATEPEQKAAPLIDYLQRISTDYPALPSLDTFGGVAGAQNVGHLANVMLFGENGIPSQDWLSTFIDDDVVMPGNANEIFRMIGLYHTLGTVSVIASSYLHHSGNPISLAFRALNSLMVNAETMSDQEISELIDGILRRTPSIGLRDEHASDSKYGHTPEATLAFPGGNFTLSGDRAFDVPVPIVGVEDLGFIASLHLFCGARQLGVARVPDFIHRRCDRQAGGSVNGGLEDFCRAERDVAYGEFRSIAERFATNVLDVPEENVQHFRKAENAKRRYQLRQQRKTLQTLDVLSRNARFAPYVPVLTSLKHSVRNFAIAKTKGAEKPLLDHRFIEHLLGDMVLYHGRLVRKAYAFGVDGEFDSYSSY